MLNENTDSCATLATVLSNGCARFGTAVSQKKLKRVHCVLLVLSMFFSGLFSVFTYLQFVVRCSESEGVNEIETMCHLYHTKQITGNLCSKLCDENVFRYSQCGGNRFDKKVQILDCYGCVEPGVWSKVVLKSELGMALWDSRIRVTFSDSESLQSKIQKTNAEILRSFRELFQTDYSNHSDPLKLILDEDFSEIVRTVESDKAEDIVLRTILSLAAQKEIIAMKVFGPSSYIPKLYGTCGPAYLVEYTPPFGNLNYVIFQGKVTEIFKLKQHLPSWNERAGIALRMIELIRKTETDFGKPVHFCDATAGNFGINDKGDVILLDTGSVEFDNIVRKRPCEQDSDCDRSTCPGSCNLTTGWCGEQMRSNTLQTVCRKVFLSPVERFGLLRNAPSQIADELGGLVHTCAYPAHIQKRLPKDNWSDRAMMKKLELVLNKSLTL